MEIKEVKGNTFCIDTGMTYIPFYKINEEEIIMLDSGWAKRDQKGIDQLLDKNNLKVIAIICSHAHIDHSGNNAYLKNKYNCVIAMPAYEALISNSMVNLKIYFRNHALTDVIERFGHMVCETDIMIWDNQDSIRICDIEFKILFTPGHTPEHICIMTPDNVAYLADALISYEVIAEAKMPYVYILSEDLKSKEKLLDLKCSKYVVAHKGIYDDITKLITDNIDFYKNIAKRVYEVIEGSMTMETITKTVVEKFGIPVNSIDKHTEIERIIRSYVEYLSEEGLINLSIEDGFIKYKKVVINN